MFELEFSGVQINVFHVLHSEDCEQLTFLGKDIHIYDLRGRAGLLPVLTIHHPYLHLQNLCYKS